MIKIAIDCRMIGSGGIGSFISELLPYFLAENECLLIGTHEQCSDYVRMPNTEFCFCDVKPFSFRETFFFPPDVLEKIHQYDYYFTPYCNIPGGLNLPTFSVIHDVVFLDVDGMTGFLGRFARKIFYKRAINYSDAIFTVSEFSKERIIHHLKCKKNIEIVYNAAPKYLTEDFPNGKPAKKDQILFVGNIKKHKGLKYLLDAFEAARKSDSSFQSKLVIVGNAENFRTGDEETVSRISRLSASDGFIEFTGKISNERLKYLYAESKLLVQPSLYEGFGMPPLEAMTVGTPVLISDIPVFKEIYGQLPVSFFEAGNAEDLCEKLLAVSKNLPERIDISSLTELYSYKRSAEIIIKTLSGFGNQCKN